MNLWNLWWNSLENLRKFLRTSNPYDLSNFRSSKLLGSLVVSASNSTNNLSFFLMDHFHRNLNLCVSLATDPPPGPLNPTSPIAPTQKCLHHPPPGVNQVNWSLP
ncbi:hypothetical protein BT69DRAFT_1277362 [Atractiella rhizophila]|nr:hypothetical protein BT69DRAFT_1277362 [Atractiella rhizophila]